MQANNNVHFNSSVLIAPFVDLSVISCCLLLATDVAFKINCSPDAPNIVKVNMQVRCYDVLKRLVVCSFMRCNVISF